MLRLIDLLQLAVLSALCVLEIALWRRLPASHLLEPLYAGLAVLVLVMAFAIRPRARRSISLFPDLLVPIAVLLIIYETIGVSIPLVNRTWLEPALVSFDRSLFGVTASAYCQRFYNPVLLDFLHLCYFSYYFFPLSLLAIMYARQARTQYQEAVIVIGLAFYICFLLYFLFPVIGPNRNPAVRAEFSKDIWVYGGPITKLVRGFITGAETTVYDCFPSAHTAVTLLVVLLAFRYRLALRHAYTVVGLFLIASTVVLRYHYLLDLVAGALLALAVYWITVLTASLRRIPTKKFPQCNDTYNRDI